VVLSGLRWLWEATGDANYLEDGYALVTTVINATGWSANGAELSDLWAGLGSYGIMADYCDASFNCSQDNLMFKGIYFHHLDQFCEPLPTTSPLVPDLTKVASKKLAAQHRHRCNEYIPWIEHNADAALLTRNASNIMANCWGRGCEGSGSNQTIHQFASRPINSVDERNSRQVLQKPPWTLSVRYQNGSTRPALDKRDPTSKSFSIWIEKRAAENQRTVESQGSGLAVVKAAFNFRVRQANPGHNSWRAS
jgi:hypothetical protein